MVYIYKERLEFYFIHLVDFLFFETFLLQHTPKQDAQQSETESEQTDGGAPSDGSLNLGLVRTEKRTFFFTRFSLSYFTRIDSNRLTLGAASNYLDPCSVRFHYREIEGYV
jgi:hypothetical protein